MSSSVSEYWESQVKALTNRSVHVETDSPSIYQNYDDPKTGTIDARAWFNGSAFLDIFEHVEIIGSHAHRTQYSYHLLVDNVNVLRHDYDPDLPEEDRYHFHDQRTGIHMPSERITLVDLVEQCWGFLHDIRGEIDS